jgi:chromosome segregation protein
MYLKSIEISGFKSFAKKSTLEFSSTISAIVGPNGSGKSNVAEAFRFVLGEQSIKSLRGKKGEDLIFNGAGEGARSNRASVKVVFDNSRKFFNIDFPEVTIERVVHRDGVNEYLINGSQVRLKDVVELLAGAHIGASGHHIISQGEADRILSSTPRERKAMLEDALGLKIYQYKKVESERKLEKTMENIGSVESLRKEIAPHLRFLKKQVEKMEKAVSMKEELKDLSREYLKREDEYIRTNKETINNERTPLLQKKERLEKEMGEAKSTLEASKNKDAKSEKVIELEKNIHNARVERDTMLQDIGKLEGEIASEKRIFAKQKEILSSNEGKTVAMREIEDLWQKAKGRISEAETVSDLSRIKAILGEIRNIFVQFIMGKKEENNDGILKESEEAIAELSKKKIEFESNLSLARKREEELQGQYQKLQKDIEKEKDSSRDAEKALFRIMSEQNEVSGTLALLKAKEDSMRGVEEDFKRELEECAMLAGREVLDFKSTNISGGDKSFASTQEALLGEPRSVQEDRRRTIEKIKIRLEESGLSGNGEIMKEFEETSERDAFLERELTDLNNSALSLKNLIIELGEKLNIEFKVGLDKINSQFSELFELMFGGGNAKLSVIKEKKRIKKDTDLHIEDTEEFLAGEEIKIMDDEEPEEGIDIEVSLPRKKIKGLVMLSGGERALTSIALLFAISQVNPPPFIILDETDAALDEANSKKYGDMVENLSKSSQLILITHNRETMSRAGIIYGVTMGIGGVSKLLSIQFEEAVAVAK